MAEFSRIKDEACRHQFLDLFPDKEETSHDLELRLGPPGEQWFNISKHTSADLFFNSTRARNNQVLEQTAHGVLQLQQSRQESSQLCDFRGPLGLHCAEKKASSPAVHNGQKRTAPSSVVGWPPVRTSRKNLASGGSSSQRSPLSESEDVGPIEERKLLEEYSTKNKLVKINMDGILIGRKVDLNACDSYEELSPAVHRLFKGLLAAQNGTASDGDKAFRGLLDGSGEYRLVYEDNEGHKKIIGDVPWNVFLWTVKRLRVLKRSEIPTLWDGEKKLVLDDESPGQRASTHKFIATETRCSIM